MSLKRRAFTTVALGVLGAPLAIALAGLSGIGHRWVDILAQFTAPAVVGAALLGAGFLLIRRVRWAAAAAVVLALLLAAVRPQWVPADERPVPGAPVVRLYSANIHYLNDDTAAVRGSIEAADADIIVLIELGEALAGQVDTLLAGYPHRVASVWPDQARGPAQSLIASRYPLRAVREPTDGLHSVVAVATTPLGPLNVVGVHLTRPWPFQHQWGQITQATTLAGLRGKLAGPVIVAGDFNSVSSARIGRQLRGEALVPASGFPGTWPSALPSALGMTIDQVYRSPDLAFVSRSLGRPNGSDHRPVVTEITRAAD